MHGKVQATVSVAIMIIIIQCIGSISLCSVGMDDGAAREESGSNRIHFVCIMRTNAVCNQQGMDRSQ